MEAKKKKKNPDLSEFMFGGKYDSYITSSMFLKENAVELRV